VRKRIYTLRTRWSLFGRADWLYFAGVTASASLVVPASLYLPVWRELILGTAASLALILLGLERARGRRRIGRLAAQLKSIATLEKLEVPDNTSDSALDRALNEVIQRMREQARIAQFFRQDRPNDPALRAMLEVDGAPRSIAVLALGLRDQDQANVSPATMEHLREIAGTVVALAERRSALLQMQGSSTFALIFAAFSQEPAARSAKAAYDAAVELMAAHPELHFGLSSGTGLSCTLPGTGYTVIGSPLEEAIRLHRLSAAWHEYRLLCPEPVALLLRPRATGHRTALQLTAPNAPALPVYSLDLAPEVIALGA
jgi:hypothetical protein